MIEIHNSCLYVIHEDTCFRYDLTAYVNSVLRYKEEYVINYDEADVVCFHIHKDYKDRVDRFLKPHETTFLPSNLFLTLFVKIEATMVPKPCWNKEILIRDKDFDSYWTHASIINEIYFSSADDAIAFKLKYPEWIETPNRSV